ncbi:sensor histidine kinase [Gottschalkiaceae bacterium SANA]|nr:sensor histidine kinase [Gottschalkiaceae bacterium SANA]
MSLRSKIICSFVLIIALSLSVLSFLMETKIKTLRMEELEHNTAQLIDSKANEIGSWLNQRISEIRIIHENPSTKTMNFEEIKPYLSQLNEVLRGQYGNPNETFAIGGIDGQGWVNDQITIDISTRDYFLETMTTKNEYIISNPIVSKSDNNPIFILCYPIINEQNERVGFINGSVNIKKFSEIVDTIDLYNGFTWIMNTNQDIYSIDATSLRENYLSSNGLASIVHSNLTQSSGTVDLINMSNQDSTVFYSSIPYTEDWILCTMIENRMITAQTDSIIRYILYVGILLFIISIFLAVIVSNSIVKPIQSLKTNMIEVSHGNLQSYYDFHNTDEVSVLGQVFNQMLSKIENLINQVVHEQKQKRNAEFRALQSQINPHFLYNTLDTLQWKALEYDAFEVADLVNSLSRFFRISLSAGNEYIPLAKEIEHVQNYLDIQQVRYKDKVNHTITVDPVITQKMVPKLIIQPLVENAIYHGLKPRKENGHIEIIVSSDSGFLLIEVRDDGIGMNPQQLAHLQTNLANSVESDHYGLYNINERLKYAFGDDYQIRVTSLENQGTIVLLKIPIQSEELPCIEL